METNYPEQNHKEFSERVFNREPYKQIKLEGLDIQAKPQSQLKGFGSHALFSDNTVRHNLSSTFLGFRMGHGHSLLLNVEHLKDSNEQIECFELLEQIKELLKDNYKTFEYFQFSLPLKENLKPWQYENAKSVYRLMLEANWFHTNGRINQVHHFLNEAVPDFCHHLDLHIRYKDSTWENLLKNGIFGDHEEDKIILRIPLFISEEQLKDITLRIKEVIN